MSNPELPPVITVDGVHKVFRDFWGRAKVQALKGIHFQVRQGQVFGLLGPNGSGKSTTMKLLLGLLRPSRGSLRILGADPQAVRVKSRIGYMPEESYLYPYLSPDETLRLYGRLLGLSEHENKVRAGELLDMIGLTHARRRPVGEFSKGMARRISLAQALLNDPELILLDEPTAGLDPLGCRQFKDLILHLARRGKTIVLCSHLLADVEDVCDRIAILYNGRICAEGRMRDLLQESRICRLSIPQPSPALLDSLQQTIRQATGQEAAIDHPARSLEDLFLSAIRSAETDRTPPSGAQPEGLLAPFLRGNPAAPMTRPPASLP
jgi:ABC-2 type transport system ATP-binding protein